MKLSRFFLKASLIFSGVVMAQDRLINGFPELPRDARRVAERSIACQHFAGEISGTGDDRDRQVSQQIRKLRCESLERDADRIKQKYKHRAEVIKLVNESIQWLAT